MRMQVMQVHGTEGESHDDDDAGAGGGYGRDTGAAGDRTDRHDTGLVRAVPHLTGHQGGRTDPCVGAGRHRRAGEGGVRDFLAQGRQAFANVERVLAAAGSSLADVVKVGIFVTDMAADLGHVIALRQEFLSEPYPRTPSWKCRPWPGRTGG